MHGAINMKKALFKLMQKTGLASLQTTVELWCKM